MSLAIVQSRGLSGMHAPSVTVEVHLANGLPSFTIVGLPDTEVRESKDRVRAALLTSHFDFPAKRITVNLAPADLPKESGRFDLPIAVGLLAASGQIPSTELANYEFAGELALTGELRPIRGALAMVYQAWQERRAFILPPGSAQEAALLKEATIYQASSLLTVCAHLSDTQRLPILKSENTSDFTASPDEGALENTLLELDLAQVKGQKNAKRALEVAAAGRHSLLMSGPPGTGKSMLASRLPGLLPTMTDHEAIESAAIWSLTGLFKPKQWKQRPFRNPHHTASAVALVGGGSEPKPGEISLAHHGILFLDELPEFDRKVLEVLREPLESGTIHIARANRHAEFPANFQLITAMNPCPCGMLGHPQKACRCTPEQIARYHSKISGPLLDRLDLMIEVPVLPTEALSRSSQEESSTQVRQRVQQAWKRQQTRQEKANSALTPSEIAAHCALNAEAEALLHQAAHKLQLSARGYHRILKVARTIADLAGENPISTQHLAEAIQYRRNPLLKQQN